MKAYCIRKFATEIEKKHRHREREQDRENLANFNSNFHLLFCLFFYFIFVFYAKYAFSETNVEKCTSNLRIVKTFNSKMKMIVFKYIFCSYTLAYHISISIYIVFGMNNSPLSYLNQ